MQSGRTSLPLNLSDLLIQASCKAWFTRCMFCKYMFILQYSVQHHHHLNLVHPVLNQVDGFIFISGHLGYMSVLAGYIWGYVGCLNISTFTVSIPTCSDEVYIWKCRILPGLFFVLLYKLGKIHSAGNWTHDIATQKQEHCFRVIWLGI